MTMMHNPKRRASNRSASFLFYSVIGQNNQITNRDSHTIKKPRTRYRVRSHLNYKRSGMEQRFSEKKRWVLWPAACIPFRVPRLLKVRFGKNTRSAVVDKNNIPQYGNALSPDVFPAKLRNGEVKAGSSFSPVFLSIPQKAANSRLINRFSTIFLTTSVITSEQHIFTIPTHLTLVIFTNHVKL